MKFYINTPSYQLKDRYWKVVEDWIKANGYKFIINPEEMSFTIEPKETTPSTKFPNDFIQYTKKRSAITGKEYLELVPLSDRDALEVLSRFFLNKNFTLAKEVPKEAENVFLVNAILNKFKHKYKKFCKKLGWKFTR